MVDFFPTLVYNLVTMAAGCDPDSPSVKLK
jgi:hypothetical protein